MYFGLSLKKSHQKEMDLEELAMLLECVDVNSYTPTEFASALERAKTCSFEDDQKLVLYGLFKQATVGEINIESPPQSDMVNYAKWNAWRGFAGFPQNSAMASYVYLVESWENEKETKFDKFLDGNKLGGPSAMAPTVSTLLESSADSSSWDSTEAIFDAIVGGDVAAVRDCLSRGIDVNAKSKEGLSPLHFASDRGVLALVQLLVEQGADLSAVDEEQQTALDLATLCEHDDVVAYLRSKLPPTSSI